MTTTAANRPADARSELSQPIRVDVTAPSLEGVAIGSRAVALAQGGASGGDAA